jgi:DNA/RNA-binding domain of Phe-tRNA-synthetase-like protein
MIFEVSETWQAAFPHARVGVLVMCDVVNPAQHADLDREKESLEQQVRSRFAGQSRGDLDQLPVLQAYAAYYRRFKKTYHVQLQLESIVFKGKAIPSVAALVEAMFMAEVKNLLLTAGHDLDALQLPVRLDVSQGDEVYTVMRGQSQQLKPGDMLIADRMGIIISSILYGPDQRTQIQAGTRNVMFTVYAPDGIREQAVLEHLHDIEQYVCVVAPDSRVELLQVFGVN